MLSLVLGSPQSGIYVLHELGIGPGSGCYRGGSVGRRGYISGGWILGKYIGAWLNKYREVVVMPSHSTPRIWHQPARAVPLLVATGEFFDALRGIGHVTGWAN